MTLFRDSATFKGSIDPHYWADVLFLRDFYWILLHVIEAMGAMYLEILPHLDLHHHFSLNFHQNMKCWILLILQKMKYHFNWMFDCSLTDSFRLLSFLSTFWVFSFLFSCYKFDYFWQLKGVRLFCCYFPIHETIFAVSCTVCPCPLTMMSNFEFFMIIRSKLPYFRFILPF